MPATLLIIEDNVELLRLLRELLAERFTVLTAITGEGGLEMARLHTPDLALVDVDLPGIDGVDTALRLKAQRAPAPFPVLILTAHASAGQEARIRATGCCDDFLSKPAPLPEISRRLEILLDSVAEPDEGPPGATEAATGAHAKAESGAAGPAGWLGSAPEDAAALSGAGT